MIGPRFKTPGWLGTIRYSDQLYFLDEGRLYVEPTTAVLPLSVLAADGPNLE